MIFDSIKNHRLYGGLGEDFREVFDFIDKTDFSKIQPGRYTLKGEVYYLVQEYESKPVSEGVFETHRKFIDVQYILSGKELHCYAHLSALKSKVPYDAEKDVELFDINSSSAQGRGLVLDRGFFAVYFPEDGHMPNLRVGTAADKNKKIVFKIPAGKIS